MFPLYSDSFVRMPIYFKSLLFYNVEGYHLPLSHWDLSITNYWNEVEQDD